MSYTVYHVPSDAVEMETIIAAVDPVRLSLPSSLTKQTKIISQPPVEPTGGDQHSVCSSVCVDQCQNTTTVHCDSIL